MNDKELETLLDYSTADLQPWQLDIYNRLNGLKPGELTVMCAGRRTGKSMMSAWANNVARMDRLDDPVTAWYKKGVQDTGLTPHKKTVDQ